MKIQIVITTFQGVIADVSAFTTGEVARAFIERRIGRRFPSVQSLLDYLLFRRGTLQSGAVDVPS